MYERIVPVEYVCFQAASRSKMYSSHQYLARIGIVASTGISSCPCPWHSIHLL